MNSRPFLIVAAFLAILVSFPATHAAPRIVPVPDADASLVQGESSDPEDFFAAGERVFFVASPLDGRTAVYVTDGTPDGTRMVPGLSSDTSVHVIGAIGRRAIVRIGSGDQKTFWATDGDESTILGTITSATAAYAGDERLFVFTETGHLWTSDGTPGSLHLVMSVNGLAWPEAATVGSPLFFRYPDPIVGSQLWVSDGTIAGTHAVMRNAPCLSTDCPPKPVRIFALGGTPMVLAPSGLWRTDGTRDGTAAIVEIRDAAVVGRDDRSAYLTNGVIGVRTDGTPAGTRTMPSLATGSTLVSNGTLYSAEDYQLKTTDGTAPPARFATLPSRKPTLLTVIGDRLLFVGTDPTHGSELWSVSLADGSSSLLKDIESRAGLASSITAGVMLRGKFVFSAGNVSGREPWVTDGTTEGTRMLANIAPEVAGAVSGTVVDLATGKPAVAVYVAAGTGEVEPVLTDSGGHYRIAGVRPGKYEVNAWGATGASPFCGAAKCSSATLVEVVAAHETTGVDISLPRWGRIRGKVTRAADGLPAGTATVVVSDSTGTVVSQPTIGNDGAYVSRALQDGTYRVHVDPWSYSNPPLVPQWFDRHDCPAPCAAPVSDIVTIAGGADVKNVDFSLRGYGTISGTVRAATDGAPLANLTVQFNRVGSTGSGARVTTDADGKYSFTLNPGSYRVQVLSGAGFVGQLYPDIACPSECATGGRELVVPVAGEVRGIDFGLAQSKARIKGTITDRKGVAFGDVAIDLLGTRGNVVATTRSGQDGTYGFVNVQAGDYYLKVLDEFAGGGDCIGGCRLEDVAPTTVAATDLVRRDVSLKSLRTNFKVVLRDAVTSAPIQGQVTLWGPSRESLGPNCLGACESFSITDRRAGYYAVASADGYYAMAFPDRSLACTNCDPPADATLIEAGGDVTMTFSMIRRETVSGSVRNVRTGKGLFDARVLLVSAAGEVIASGWTRADGTYTIQCPPGVYRLYALAASGSAGRVYPDVPCDPKCNPAAGGSISVGKGGAVAGIDLSLAVDGGISGRITDGRTGAPLGGATVVARSATGSVTMVADAAGAYAGTLQPGTYRVWTWLDASTSTGQFGGAVCLDREPCDTVTVNVTAPANLTGIDIALRRVRIEGVTPASGPASGGTRIIVRGENFPEGAVLRIGGTPATIVSRSSDEIVATTPPGAPGDAHVTVEAGAVKVIAAYAYSYGPSARRRAIK